jgi:steroid delta-isomerase-like uncharacterized protein
VGSLLAFCLVLTACAPDDDVADDAPTDDVAVDDDDPAPDAAPATDQTVRFLMAENFWADWSPYASTALSQKRLERHIYDYLVDFPTGDLEQPEPMLATSWEQVDDTTWEFSLRDDAVFHDRDASDYRGVGELRAFVKTYRDAFPDVRYTVDEQITGGDTVVTHWTARGTHRGELMNMPPTGREVEVSGISIDRFADGRITESTAHWDALGMLQQLGAVPEQITRKT